jgi:hypothetical protein
MVISQIIGGLGNQMFQYAAGRALSLKIDTPLVLDISGFEDYRLHQGFELQRVFNCPFEIASKADVRMVLGWQSPAIVRKIVSRKPFSSIFRRRFVADPFFYYWPGINSLSKNTYLAGYWQSEKYFCNVASQIRADFSFRLPLENNNAELVRQIGQVNAVSLHVRRGDYASDPKTTATHGLCSLDYYRAAIRHVSERVQQPTFFVFSDDIAWIKSNLQIDFPHQYIDHNHGTESYNDMRLMSLCRHHIIANSSFSWWGAWLNPSIDKIVIAPKRWFANQTDVRDLLPQDWVKL